MCKADHHKHTDRVQENNKNVLILNPFHRGKKMVKNHLPQSQDYDLSLYNVRYFSKLFQNYYFIGFLHESYEVNRVSNTVSEMRKWTQNGSHLKSRSSTSEFWKTTGLPLKYSPHYTRLWSGEHWFPKFQSAWHRNGTQ